MSGKLYIVGTPIGNLQDMTFRAVATLKDVDAIGCEDTRHSLTLLNFYEIKKPLFACHQHNEKESVSKISAMLDEGKNVAIITDAGMPSISDPGAIIVGDLFASGYDIEVVPSATAFASAMALSGICQPVFTFVGFLPEKQKDRQVLLEQFENVKTSLIFYCSPYDINKDCKFLAKTLGNRKAHIIKEITKIHERHEICYLENCEIENPKGEYVVIVEASEDCGKIVKSELPIVQQVEQAINSGLTKKDAIKKVARDNGVPKDDVYKVTLDILK